jgi:hypothetical protein
LAVLGVTGGHSTADGRDGGYISVDGEKVAFEPFQVEVHRALGTVLSRSGAVYEADGPAGWDDDPADGGEGAAAVETETVQVER